MITFDGDRSKKRRWFANSKLRLLKLLNLPSKSLMWEGFRFSIWQQNDLSGGRITAPAGLIVTASTTSGIKISMSEYWGGGVTSLQDMHAVGFEPGSSEKPAIRWFQFPTEEDFIASGFDIFKYVPFEFMTAYDQGDTYSEPVYNIANTETSYADLSCAPGLHPFESAEAIWFTLVDRADYEDPNPNSGYEYSKSIYEQLLFYYLSDNSNYSGRLEFLLHEDWHWQIWTPSAFHPAIPKLYSVQQRIDSNKVAVIRNSISYTSYASGLDMIVAWELFNPSVGVEPLSMSRLTLADLIPDDSDLPTALRDMYVSRNSTSDSTFTSAPAGTYCFKLNDIDYVFHAVRAVAANSDSGDPGEELGNYFRDNPGHAKWNLFYILKVGETSHIVNSDNFLSLLDSKSTFDLVSETTQVSPDYDYIEEYWTKAAEVLRYIAMVPPINYNSIFPYDSYMFHTGLGEVVCWSRRLGVYKFTTTGLESDADFEWYLPSEVTSEEGVQPKISYAGTYEETDCYLCICEKLGEEVKAVYFGSPFTTPGLSGSWEKLPELPSEYTILFIRPIKVSPTMVRLIGIAKSEVDAETTEYRVITISYTGEEEWQVLAKLPFEYVDKTVFSACLFGDAQAVKDMAEYPTPLSAIPQIPIGPYNLYTSEL